MTDNKKRIVFFSIFAALIMIDTNSRLKTKKKL